MSVAVTPEALVALSVKWGDDFSYHAALYERTWSGTERMCLAAIHLARLGQARPRSLSQVEYHACFTDGVLKLSVGPASLKSAWPGKPSLAVRRVSVHCLPNIGRPYKHGKNKEGNAASRHML